MKCKYLKYRSKKRIYYKYCSLYKEILYSDKCIECKNKEYKKYKTISKRSNKLNKKEKKRYSIIYTDLTKCCICGLKNGDYDERIKSYTHIDKNEVFEGSKRQLSIDYGMITPFCTFCHKEFHSNSNMNLEYKVMFQKNFMKEHTKEDFIHIFGQDYIYINSKKGNF